MDAEGDDSSKGQEGDMDVAWIGRGEEIVRQLVVQDILKFIHELDGRSEEISRIATGNTKP